jgi:hypothetical protein
VTDANWLKDVLRDLAAIDREGKLEELATQHALECRKRQLPPDNELRDPDADFTAKRIARFASQMTGVSADECERVGRERLRFHPRRDLLEELISFYKPTRGPR